MCLRQKNSKLLLVARPVEQKNREGRECIVASWVPAPDVQCIGCLRPHGELCQLRTQCARGTASEFLRHSHDFTVLKGYPQHRKSVVQGKSVSVRVDIGVRRAHKYKQK